MIQLEVHLNRWVTGLVWGFFCLMLAVNRMFYSVLTCANVKVLLFFFSPLLYSGDSDSLTVLTIQENCKDKVVLF